ncbi:MAG: magnesium-translocating P-type ATPase [Dehalococcoidia bacterium]|nr:magnesium-translocating P-type ATPase [Dehalococcoidia bacterium]
MKGRGPRGRQSSADGLTNLPFWSTPPASLLQDLHTSVQGLSSEQARVRLSRYGANLLKPKARSDAPAILLSQFKSPVVLILIFAAVLSLFLHDSTDAIIIITIVALSSLLGFWQEHRASRSIERLLAIVRVTARAVRDGQAAEVPIEEVVPGDVVMLAAGDAIPGDCFILEAKDLFVDEAPLTGEAYPVEKAPGIVPPETPLARRSNCLFLGTHVISGTGKAIVVHTGRESEFGNIYQRLRLRPPETDFERGVRRFGYMLMEVTLVLVIAIFGINVYLNRPVLDSLLFSLALAVGLTPQLLPAIVSVNLAHGAQQLARAKVIVKRLASIENFGSMTVLCSDKTGTLTEGVVKLHVAVGADGNESEKLRLLAYLNAFYETGFNNPIDDALRSELKRDVSDYAKLDEVPYDFVRKRLTVLVSHGGSQLMVTKGAMPNVLAACSSVEGRDGAILGVDQMRDVLQQRFQEFSDRGYRVLGLAYREAVGVTTITQSSEVGLTFLGFLVFFDPPKPEIVRTIEQLNDLGVSLKVISGDNRLVVQRLGEQLGLSHQEVLTGPDIRQMSNEALTKRAAEVALFAEIEPNQKERIIVALKQGGSVVGFIGDGINDAPALHAADVGISVDGAVDTAKEAADIVLLEKDLGVLLQGVRMGRRTFANTLKYVFMATSANFGNMFSMASSSAFLGFLPMLPKQVLATNLMTDFPEMTISTDNVDDEMVQKPQRWNLTFIRRFMLAFGLLSTLFDFATFGVLLLALHATTEQFRTGWFVESAISASVIVLVIRSRKPLFRSRPGRYLVLATIGVAAVVLALPFTGLGRLFGFVSLPASFLLFLLGVLACYVVCAELAKWLFYRWVRP